MCMCVCTLQLQIFVEIERARLTRRLAAMKEQEDKIGEAADILQEVPVVRGACMAQHRTASCTAVSHFL